MSAVDSGRTLRFDPLALVPDTSFRFALLIVAVVGSALYLASPWGFAFLPQVRASDEASVACLGTAVQPRVPAPIGGLRDVNDRLREPGRRISVACTDPASRLRSLRGLGLVVVSFALGVLLVALAIYWLTPPWLIRRRRLVPIPASEMPALAASLDRLRHEAGVRAVTFLVDPVDPRRSGFAFGRAGRRFVVLGRGILHCFHHDHDLYRTVVRHELAHIRNGDLDPTFLAIAVWRAFLVIVVGPQALFIAIRLALIPAGLALRAADLQLAWRLVVLAVLVLLVRNAVLRSRELCADVSAAQWGAGDTLSRLFAGSAAIAAPAGLARRLMTTVRHAFRTHPDPGARRDVLAGARLPLGAGAWDGMALGIVATFAAGSVELAAGWLAGGLDYRPGSIVSFALVVPLALACCVVAFRTVLAAQVTGTALRLNRFAEGLGVGLVGGSFLGPSSASFPPGVEVNGQSPPGLASWALWIGLAVVLAVLFVRWLEVVIRAWMPRMRGRVSSDRLLILAGGAAALVLGFWLRLLLQYPGLVAVGHQLAFPDLPEVVVAGSLIALFPVMSEGAAFPFLADGRGIGLLVLVVGLWALPVAGWLLTRGDPAPLPAWASLDPVPADRRLTVLRLRPLVAVRAGLSTSVVLVLALAAAYAALFLAVRGTRTLATVVLLPTVVPVLASVVSAARAAAGATALRPLHGLIAASVAGPVTAVGSGAALHISACGLLRVCDVPGSLLPPEPALDLAYGILLGGVAAWFTGTVVERRRPRGDPRPGRWARRVGWAALVLVGIVLIVLVEGAAAVILPSASVAAVTLVLLAAGGATGLRWGRSGLFTALVVVAGAIATTMLLAGSIGLRILPFLAFTQFVPVVVGYGLGRRVRRTPRQT
jgi:Peptidase family M48